MPKHRGGYRNSGVCMPCRRRKVKCDAQLPICSHCERLGLDCRPQRSQTRVSWLPAMMTGSPSLGDMAERENLAGNRRQALFSVEESALRCELLVGRSLNSVNHLLAEIDSVSESPACDDFFTGPFGLIWPVNSPEQPGAEDESITAGNPLNTGSPSITVDPISTCSPEMLDIDNEVGLGPACENPLPDEMFTGQFDFNWPANSPEHQGIAEDQIFASANLLDTNGSSPTANLISTSCLENLPFDPEALPQDCYSLGQDEHLPMEDFLATSLIRRVRPINFSPLQSPPSPLSTRLSLRRTNSSAIITPEHSHYLLSHYHSQLVAVLAGVNDPKPPWKAIHLPCAFQAMSELDVLGYTSSAKKSLLYSILAASAFQIDKLSPNARHERKKWSDIGWNYQKNAQDHLKVCLKENSGSHKNAKYKEVLMALMSMITICVVNGRQQDARCFLIDAEKFIRMRGMNKQRKSPKVQTLHSMFLYLRTIQESLHVYPTTNGEFTLDEIMHPSDITQNNMLPTEARIQYPSLTMHHVFKNVSSAENYTKLDQELCQSAGSVTENGSRFQVIYGIPSSLLILLSKITYLGNLGDHSNFDISSTASLALSKYVKVVEDELCSWKNSVEPPISSQQETRSCPETAVSAAIYSLNEVMHTALLVFFYSRVRRVNSTILQPHVRIAISQLRAYEETRTNNNIPSPGICWPAFIIACEALEEKDQTEIGGWLGRAAQSSGMRSFDLALEVATKVWEARRQANSADISWRDILRDENMVLVLT